MALAVYESVVIIFNLYEITNSHEYISWMKRRIAMVEKESVDDFVKKDDILKHLCCAITGEIPKLPAKISESDKVYEYEKAVSWIKDHPGTPLPGCRKIVGVDELLFDYSQLNAVIQRVEILCDLLKDERDKKVYSIFGVKRLNPDNYNKITMLIEMVNLCELNGSSAEFFSGFSLVKNNFIHMDKIRFRLDSSKGMQRKVRLTNFSRAYSQIIALPSNTSVQRAKKMRNLTNCIRR